MVSSIDLAKDWGDYYFFGENHLRYLAFVAGFGHQNQGAVHIDGKLADGEEWGADHTCERFASLSGPIIRRQLSYVSNSSWAGSYFQPCFRNGRAVTYRGLRIEQHSNDRVIGIQESMYGVGPTAAPKLMIYHGCANYMQAGDNRIVNPGVSGMHNQNSISRPHGHEEPRGRSKPAGVP